MIHSGISIMNTIIIFCASYLIYISIIYISLRFLTKSNKRKHVEEVVIIFGSAVTAWVIAHVLKNVIAHPRPDLLNALIVPDDTYSFPSGHATFMAALAFATCYFDKKVAMFVATLAILTGICRVVAGVHFWYDILGGFVLGASIASIIVILYKKMLKR